MTFFYILIASFVLLLIGERILIYSLIYKKKRRLTFRLYYLLSFYKPFLAIAALTVFLYFRDDNRLGIAILAGLTLLTPLVSYPIAKLLYKRLDRPS